MPERIGIGVLGYSIGRAHSHAWRNVPEYYYPSKLVPELVAIAGRNRAAVSSEAKRYGYGKVYSDWEPLVRDEDVGLVDDCLPVNLHSEPMILAAKLGKVLFCEKPMARRAPEAKRMLDAAARSKVANMVGFNYRFFPSVALARKMVQDGDIGEVRYFKSGYLTTNGGFDSPDFPLKWIHKGNESGYGALSDLGTHAIDLARFVAGEIKSVSAASETFIQERPLKTGSSKKGKVDVDDLTVACVRFQEGAVGFLEASWLTVGRMDFLNFEVYGSEGSIRWNLEKVNELEVFRNKFGGNGGYRTINVLSKEHPYVSPYWPNQSSGAGWEHSYVNEFAHFLRCLAEQRPIGPEGATFEDGYRNCLIMDAMAESAKSERWVQVRS
jgi:predicted dehydrogenase